MSANDYTGTIESRKDFKNNPQGQYKYWNEELRGAQRRLKHWQKQANKIVRRYIDYRRDTEFLDTRAETQAFRLNLFHSNVSTLQAMLYGNLPTVDVSRRYADANDDVSRVAAEIMERLLNNDIEDNGDDYNSVLRACLQDRLLPGLGCARVRYEVETETTMQSVQQVSEDGMVEMVQMESERVVFEDAPIDYFHWRDMLWGWGRTFSELPWLAYRSYLTKDEVSERFGDEVAEELTYKKQMVSDNSKDEYDSMDEPEQGSVWQKAEIWEIWDKVKRKVVFVSFGYDKVIETNDDPLGLSNFYPSPPFFIANPTTSLYVATPDFHLAQDLYNEIDRLQTRIAIITEAVKVVGTYDASQGESIGRMFKEGTDNTLIPVDSWALFSEKGGINGAVDWLPIMDIVSALDKLRELRDETIQLLYQITGMSDVMRGAGGQYEGTGQVKVKAKIASVKIQALQDEFANFASGIMALKGEVIAKHFDPQTIADRANIENTYDAQLAVPAIQMIKDFDRSRIRIKIRPESVAMIDYAQLEQERTGYLNALAIFLQSAAPLIEQDAQMKPFLFQLMQWGLAGFKGSSEIESVIDKAVEMATKQAQQPRQDENAQQANIEQMKQQGEIMKIRAKAEGDAQLRQLDLQADIQTIKAQNDAKMREIIADMQAKVTETQAKMRADMAVEQVQAQSNVMQTEASADAEIRKDVVSTQLEVQKKATETDLKIEEIVASTRGKIEEEINKQSTGDSNE